MAWLASNPTGTGDPDVLLIGDYNSYAMEDPITVITNAGFTNLIATFVGPGAYSYAFDGQWGYLDHAFASASLRPQVTGVGEYHINADEPSVLDYNTDFKSAGQLSSLYNQDPFRILYRCWQDRTLYDESTYRQALTQRGSSLMPNLAK
jgi:predicted extracellular nuclease